MLLIVFMPASGAIAERGVLIALNAPKGTLVLR